MGAFKLGKMTFGSLFKQPETVKYPFQTKPQPKGLKGHIKNEVEACILCGMCERSCPTDSIKVSKPERFWEINAFSCIQCGYCVTTCPKKCLYMEPDYHPAATSITADRFEVPEQVKEAKSASATASVSASEPAPKAAKAPQPEGAPEKATTSSAGTASAQGDASAKRDPQVEELLSLMDEQAAEKVRAALGA